MKLLLILLIVFHVLAGALMGALFPPTAWLDGLAKPSFYPPNWVFPVVWPILYGCMALSLWLIIKTSYSGKKLAYAMYGAQMVVNLSYMPLFFGLKSTLLGLVDVVTLFLFLAGTIVLFFRIRRSAAFLMMPYLFWVGFALVLSGKIWFLNG